MRSTGKKLPTLLAGAVLLASAAYGIGSQTGGGGASAADDDSASLGPGARMDHVELRGRGGPFDRSGLAQKLGVDEDKLTAALEELRDERKPRGDRRRFSADLAKALGVSQERVRDALRNLRSNMRQEHRAARREFLAALAKELGVEEGKVREVLRDARRAGPGAWPSQAEMAKRLGVSEAKLRAAFEKVGPKRAGSRRDRMKDGLAADLAKELGLEENDVQAALAKLHKQHEAEHKRRHAAFTKALAEKLGIPVSKVRSALPEPRRMLRRAMRPHRGPGGHPHRFRGGPPPAFRGGPPPGVDGGFRPGAAPPPGPGGPAGGGLNF